MFGDRVARSVLQVTHDPRELDRGGFWVVVQTFEGDLTAVRMGQVTPRHRAVPAPVGSGPAPDGPATGGWSSSMSEAAYLAGVEAVRARIAAGDVYQVNLCRMLSRPIAPYVRLDDLYRVLQTGNPAPYGCRIRVPEAGLDLVCASPELGLGRQGPRVWSRPIKGTAPVAGALLPKDRTENVMITDLVRNDLSVVAEPGSVAVPALCALERHPGLVHLVSTVEARLRRDVGWPELLAALAPAGSVSGAPKHSARRTIEDLEPVPRGPYCGLVGWVDADRQEAELAVGIRTFFTTDEPGGRMLRFGSGAGITFDSDPQGEWCETELKASRLLTLAASAMTNEGART